MKKHLFAAFVVIAGIAVAGPPSPAVSAQAGPAPRPSQAARLRPGFGGQAQQPAAPQPAAAAPAGNAANGRKLFVSFGCYQCHGYEAQGANATGPRLAPRPIAFAAFLKYVRHPTNQMPPFTTKVVTDAELTDVYAFLRSQPQPPDVDTIPLLK
jgi:cytochrome c5